MSNLFLTSPTKTQKGGFIGVLLGSIGKPLAIEAVKKLFGGGAPRFGSYRKYRLGMYDQFQTRPFNSFPKNTIDHVQIHFFLLFKASLKIL